MSPDQILITAAIAVVVTVPAVLLIPKMRQSPAFDGLLWAGTWAMAFCGAWYALENLTPSLAPVNILAIGDVAVIPASIGAAASAVLVNGLLWAMDRFESAHLENSDEPEPAHNPSPTGVVMDEEGNGGTDAIGSNQE